MSLWRRIESCVHWITDCWVSFDYSTTNVSLCKVCTIHVWGLFIITWSRFHHSPFSNSVQYLCFSHKSSCNMVMSNPCMFKWLLPTNYLTLSTKVCLCLNGHVNLKRQRTPVLLPGKSHGQRSLVGYSPWGHKSQRGLSDFTHFTFTLSQSYNLTHIHYSKSRSNAFSFVLNMTQSPFITLFWNSKESMYFLCNNFLGDCFFWYMYFLIIMESLTQV